MPFLKGLKVRCRMSTIKSYTSYPRAQKLLGCIKTRGEYVILAGHQLKPHLHLPSSAPHSCQGFRRKRRMGAVLPPPHPRVRSLHIWLLLFSCLPPEIKVGSLGTVSLTTGTMSVIGRDVLVNEPQGLLAAACEK